MVKEKENVILDVEGIMERIPHRFPFLFVDKIIQLDKGKTATGVKNVSMNEQFFAGHFPERPVMPGVLIVEALAQTACVLVFESFEKASKAKMVFFTSIDFVKFRRVVVPGDQLMLHVSILRNKLGFWKCAGVAKVGDEVAVESEFTAKVVE